MVAPAADDLAERLHDGVDAVLVTPGDSRQLAEALDGACSGTRPGAGGWATPRGPWPPSAGRGTVRPSVLAPSQALDSAAPDASVGPIRAGRGGDARGSLPQDPHAFMAVTQPYREPTVYESTATGMPPLRPYLAELWGRRRLIWHLARTDLKAEHYDSAIGQLWVVLDPLLLAAVYFLLRTVVKPAGGAGARKELIAHIVWAVFFFTFVSNALMGGARSITTGRGLVLNASFPRAVLPLVAIVKSVFDFLPTVFVYFAFHLVLGQPFGKSLLAYLPVIIVILVGDVAQARRCCSRP